MCSLFLKSERETYMKPQKSYNNLQLSGQFLVAKNALILTYSFIFPVEQFQTPIPL